MRRTFIALTFATLTGCGMAGEPTAATSAAALKNEILWDKYGVPHIYGTDTAAVFYGYGYAQALSHADEILRLYGESRGRGAEYWGEKYEGTAVWVLKNDVPARSKSWYDAQEPAFKANLDAWWIILPTFALLTVTMLLLTFIGDALRDAFDTRKS